MITILLVDNNALTRAALKQILKNHPDIKVIGEAGSEEEALTLTKQFNPNVILIDIEIPTIRGITITKKLARLSAKTHILNISRHDNYYYFILLLGLGATGYISKKANVEELLYAIRTVHAGQRYVESHMANSIASNAFNQERTMLFSSLNTREIEIMLYLITGMSISQIAEAVFLSIKTVHFYRFQIFKKLNVTNDVQLILQAKELGLIM